MEGHRADESTSSVEAQRIRGGAFIFQRDALTANTFRNNHSPSNDSTPGTHPALLEWPCVLCLVGSRRRQSSLVRSSPQGLDEIYDTCSRLNGLFALPAPTSLPSARFEDANSPALSAEVAPFISSISTPLKTQTFTTRIDHLFSDTHNGTLLYQLGRSSNLRQFGGGNRLAEALQAKTRNSDAISYSDNYVFSSNTVNQTRVQWARLTPALRSDGGCGP